MFHFPQTQYCTVYGIDFPVCKRGQGIKPNKYWRMPFQYSGPDIFCYWFLNILSFNLCYFNFHTLLEIIHISHSYIQSYTSQDLIINKKCITFYPIYNKYYEIPAMEKNDHCTLKENSLNFFLYQNWTCKTHFNNYKQAIFIPS